MEAVGVVVTVVVTGWRSRRYLLAPTTIVRSFSKEEKEEEETTPMEEGEEEIWFVLVKKIKFMRVVVTVFSIRNKKRGEREKEEKSNR